METFVWDESYATGLPQVDEQHQRLVDLINRVGDMLVAGNEGDPAIETVLAALRDYAAQHFSDEEKAMAAARLDARHAQAHILHHRGFLDQVNALWKSRGDMAHPAEIIHGYLSSWLVYHVLGEDHVMARQLALIAAGSTPEAAFAVAAEPENASVAALLRAMNKLYHVLSMQNLNLVEANCELEGKVAERTQELNAANSFLQVEHEEARALLAKVEEAQSQLLQSEKMASIGQLAAGVAHEINNPVGFVNSNLGTLKQYANRLMTLVAAYEAVETQLPAEALAAVSAAKKTADLDYVRQDLADLLKESEDGLARVKKIVQDLKDFSRVGEVEWQEADVVAGLESTLNVVWNEIKYKAEVVRELSPLPLVRCVPAQLNQVFMNLLVNAAHAIEERGTITLKSGVDSGHVWIEVADTGHGMTAEVRRRIFEPFFTTKPVGKGTGLGLSLSYDIVTKHGGSFDVASEPGKGTTFRVWLPICGPDADAGANENT